MTALSGVKCEIVRSRAGELSSKWIPSDSLMDLKSMGLLLAHHVAFHQFRAWCSEMQLVMSKFWDDYG
jgi:hypothetical protein